jgi:hypothetical protein
LMKRLILLGLTPLVLSSAAVQRISGSVSSQPTHSHRSGAREILFVAQAPPPAPSTGIRQMAVLPSVGLVAIDQLTFGPPPPAPASTPTPEPKHSGRREAPPPPVAGQVSFEVSPDDAAFYRWFRSATSPKEASRYKPQTITLLYYDIDGNQVGQTNLLQTTPVSEQPATDNRSSTFTFNYASFNFSSSPSQL